MLLYICRFCMMKSSLFCFLNLVVNDSKSMSTVLHLDVNVNNGIKSDFSVRMKWLSSLFPLHLPNYQSSWQPIMWEASMYKQEKLLWETSFLVPDCQWFSWWWDHFCCVQFSLLYWLILFTLCVWDREMYGLVTFYCRCSLPELVDPLQW